MSSGPPAQPESSTAAAAAAGAATANGDVTIGAAPAAPAKRATAPFLLPAAHRRVRTLDAAGVEEHAVHNPWVHMQLTDPFLQQSQPAPAAAAAAAAADDDSAAAEQAPQQKEAVMAAFAAAKGELEWLLAMLSTLQEGRYLTVGRVEKTTGQQRLVDVTVSAHSRYRRRAAAASSAAAVLSEGAAALAALSRKEDAFYEQVAELQRYWKVHSAPPGTPFAYVVDLQLCQQQGGASSSSGGASGGSSAAAGAAPAAGGAAGGINSGVGRGPVAQVFILKDPSGMLRVQVPAPKANEPPTVTFKAAEEPPAVFTGPAAIHGLLLQQLRLNAWHQVLTSLDAEITHMLGLPSRLQPSAVAAAKAAAAAGTAAQPAAAEASVTTQASAPARTASGSGSSSSSRPLPAAGGHLSFYAALSNLVLQAVIGSAATAGEAAVLERQQQQQQQQQADQDMGPSDAGGGSQQQPEQRRRHGAAGGGGGSASSDPLLLLGDVDVGEPWERAAAAAAAATRQGQPSAGADAREQQQEQQQQQQQQQQAAALPAVPGSSSVGSGSSVCVDPQLLALRPLALEHLLLTQLGHLAPFSLRTQPAVMAASAYAAAARLMAERQQQRQQQQAAAAAASGGSGSSTLPPHLALTRGDSGGVPGGGRTDSGSGAALAAAVGGASSSSSRPGVNLLGSAVSFMTCLSRWLAHSSSRDLLRARLDEQLLAWPGIVARSMPACCSCTSAMQLTAEPSAARAANAQQHHQAAAAAALRALCGGCAPPPLLLLLCDTAITLEGVAVAAAAAAGGGSGAGPLLGQPSRARDVQQSVTYLHSLPALLAPLLEAMAACAGGDGAAGPAAQQLLCGADANGPQTKQEQV